MIQAEGRRKYCTMFTISQCISVIEIRGIRFRSVLVWPEVYTLGMCNCLAHKSTRATFSSFILCPLTLSTSQNNTHLQGSNFVTNNYIKYVSNFCCFIPNQSFWRKFAWLATAVQKTRRQCKDCSRKTATRKIFSIYSWDTISKWSRCF